MINNANSTDPLGQSLSIESNPLHLFAEVALDVPIDKTFDYIIPSQLKNDISIGKRVTVPFGKRDAVGIVIGFRDKTDIRNLKEIIKVNDAFPLIDEKMINVAKWVSCYYCASIGQSIFLNIPSRLKKDAIPKKSRKTNQAKLAQEEIFVEAPKIELNREQNNALHRIKSHLGSFRVFLLHGVTASGKTEIYLKAAEEVLKNGKDVIVLVPEIALTIQTMNKFKAKFKDKVAIIHSGLSEGKKYQEWLNCLEGRSKLVIGARSALFAPFKNVGLIIIDEEHEPSYKEMTSPKYNTRDVAIKRAEAEECPVILGSATPSLESFYKTSLNEYELIELKERFEKRLLPEVKIVDMADEYQFRRMSIFFSRILLKELEKILAKKEQAILFLNRRGFATIVSCKSCGQITRCSRCDSVMVYHSGKGSLVCHYCNLTQRPPVRCPKCESAQFKFLGIGTEKVESEINRLFPKARVARLDTDVTKKKGVQEKILDGFRRHEVDILVGTQMVAKGLDFPDVTLIGVISSDINLNIPDFRASERTFNLLTQVAGRSGRGKKEGLVIIQTYNPKHYSIIESSKHSYENFYKAESSFRKELNLPPYVNLVKVTFLASKSEISQSAALSLKGLLIKEYGFLEDGFQGPVPGVIFKIKNRFIWNLFLKTGEVLKVSRALKNILGDSRSFNKAYVNIDVDPV